MNERRHERGVKAELQVNQPWITLGKSERREIDDAQRIGQSDEGEERIDRERARPAELNQDRRAEQQRADHDTRCNQRREAGSQMHFSLVVVGG